MRDVAEAVGITERSTQTILADLLADGYLSKRRVGRRNVYRVNHRRPFRHPAEAEHKIGDLLNLFADEAP